jgi:hypothetical protein
VIASVSGALFLGVFGGLSYQMAASKDPALGPKARALVATSNAPVRQRIVKRTIILRKVRRPAPGSAPGVSTGPAGASAPRPTAAPVVVAPPTPPPPATVVTRTS